MCLSNYHDDAAGKVSLQDYDDPVPAASSIVRLHNARSLNTVTCTVMFVHTYYYPSLNAFNTARSVIDTEIQ